jgi:CheY-like chemotaxis protein
MPLRSSQISPSQGRNAQGRILLVDGNTAGLAARKTVLSERGHIVLTAANATEALEQLATAPFDLIVADHKPPRMDGLALLRKVQASAAPVPVIILSGLVQALGLTEQSTGAAAVIQKSSEEVTQLVRAADRILKRKPARKGPASQASTAPPKVKKATRA